MRGRTVLAISAALLLASCGGQEQPERPAPTAPARPASTAEIRVIEPEPGAEVEGPDVRVEIELTGAELIEEVKQDLAPDEGHMHLKLDGETITLLGTLEEVIPDVEPGPHLLEVEFVAADHGPFHPRVVQTIAFRVT